MPIEQLLDNHSYGQVDSNRYLRLIGELDRMQMDIVKDLQHKRKFILEKAQSSTYTALQNQLAEVKRLEKQAEYLSEEKIAVAVQLENLVRAAKEDGEKEYQRIAGYSLTQYKKRKPVVEQKPSRAVSDAYQDSEEQKFCYCEHESEGEMINCDNPFCEREWYHIKCLEQKPNLSKQEIWYCKECKKRKEHRQELIYRMYFSEPIGIKYKE